MTHDPLDWLDAPLARLRRHHLLRQPSRRSGTQGRQIRIEDRELINFGANDYLGLAADPRLANAAGRASEAHGWGSGASPLISGRTQSQADLERGLAEFEQTEAALVFPSGFAANVGTVTSLAGRGDVIFSDRNNHASLIDGCRLSRAHVQIYDSEDLSSLQSGLRATSDSSRRFIVTDSLFSMDGSLAPLPDLVDLAEHHSAILIVDEAHATGVFGQQGRGVCEQMQVEQHVPVKIGTLSKAVGSIGGFVVGQQRLIDWIFNRGRTQVFSTALPAACHAASLAGLQIIRDEPHRRRDLQHHADQLRAGLAEQGWRIDKSASQIVPLIVGESERTIRYSAQLSDLGLFVPGIRPPTVPHGTSRLRISLSYAHTQDDRNRLLAALRQLTPMD